MLIQPGGDVTKTLHRLDLFRQAEVEATELLKECRKHYGDEELAPFREEWEASKRLGALINKMERQLERA